MGARAELGDPGVGVSGPQRGHPGFGDQDVPTGVCLSDWTVLSNDPGCVSAPCHDPSGWHHAHPPFLSGMSTPGSSPQHRPAGVSPLSLSTEARRQQAQQVSPTLSPLSPITQVRGLSGAGEVGPGSASLGGLTLLPGSRILKILPTFFLLFVVKFSNTRGMQKSVAWIPLCPSWLLACARVTGHSLLCCSLL